jgi:dihydrofolate reductase
MAELTYAMITSLDGYIADENGTFDWARPSDELHAIFNDLQRSVGTCLQGRRMYETMRWWDSVAVAELPPIERGFAELWRDTDKIVYSSTLEAVAEPRTRLERTFAVDAIRTMKRTADRDLSIGGAGLAAHAILAGLVDRYVLAVVPTIVGAGTRALPDAARLQLTLADAQWFSDGAVLLQYRAA